jgi:non-specific serine/threonine protein kinase
MQTTRLDALAPWLSPQGQLRLVADPDASPLAAAIAERLAGAFARGSGAGLLQLGAAEVGSVLPPALAWWRDWAAHYVTALCATPEGAENLYCDKMP